MSRLGGNWGGSRKVLSWKVLSVVLGQINKLYEGYYTVAIKVRVGVPLRIARLGARDRE
jgi:hypothetical protein